MASNGLIAQPLTPTATYNWVLLIEVLVCGILGIFFFAYFDRLFATVISYAIRWYTWRNFRAYIDIKALQFSLIGGRIFFKDIRYHAQNVTVVVHSGYITWNYWLRKVRKAEVYTHDESTKGQGRKGSDSTTQEDTSRSRSAGREDGGKRSGQSNKDLPCRLHVQVEGVQAFIYNRSPVYDAIIANFRREAGELNPVSSVSTDEKEEEQPEKRKIVKTKQFLWIRRQVMQAMRSARLFGYGDQSAERASIVIQEQEDLTDRPALPFFLRVFPIKVDCKVGGAVLGNDNTRSLITAKFGTASGVFDAGQAGPLDIFRQIFDFKIDDIVARMLPNPDYVEPQLAAAVRLKTDASDEHQDEPKKQKRKWSMPRFFRKSSGASNKSVRTASSEEDRKQTLPFLGSNKQQDGRWRGLTRYLDETLNNEHEEWGSVEYGLSSTLAEVPSLGFTFYWDVPGLVKKPNSDIDEKLGDPAAHVDINGAPPPEYGMELCVYGGTVNYGPWADRQRGVLQNIFFAPSFSDAVPATNLQHGDSRISTIFKLFLQIEEDVVLRIPTREPSKDWRWKGKAEALIASKDDKSKQGRDRKKRGFWRNRDKTSSGPTSRPFAWLDVKVAMNTTISYVMDMVARQTGYEAHLDGDIRGVEISTSVNHGLLWRSGPTGLRCHLPAPKRWNAIREWQFDVTNSDLELFILRDHLFLLTDLIGDWSNGPPPEYFTFIPYKYTLNIKFTNFKLYLNTNDSNIIDNPTELDENNLMILYGRELTGDVIIPLDKFRPKRNEIFFNVLGKGMGLDLRVNVRNTVSTFTGQHTVAQVDEVTLKGSHANCTVVSTELTDRLTFFIHGSKVALRFYGFVVAHLIKVKENLFGEHLHFKTLEEFQSLPRDPETGLTVNASGEDPKAQQSNRSNDLDVILCITVDDVSGQLPANLYSADENVVAEVAYAGVDLRITNYYMDLQVDISPISISHHHNEPVLGDPNLVASRTELFIDGVSLGGHRQFGLPPAEPTYVCHWDIDVGKITGEASTKFVEKFVQAIRCFTFGMSDAENVTPLMMTEVIHDITFMRLKTDEIKVAVLVDGNALMLETAPVTVQFNDWANSTCSERLKVEAPSISLSCIDAQAALRSSRPHNVKETTGRTFALLKTALSVRMLKRRRNFTAETAMQQNHLIEQDQRTLRSPFLASEKTLKRAERLRTAVEPPALDYPRIPVPLAASLRSRRQQMLRRQTSRSSVRSSLKQQSALRPNSILAESASFRRRSTVAMIQTPSEYEGRDLRGSIVSLRGFRSSIPSSIALTSRLATPYFGVLDVCPDPGEMPDYLPESGDDTTNNDSLPTFNDVAMKQQDEKLIHTNVIISAEPGIQGFIEPQAIHVVAQLFDSLLPKGPEELLDGYQMDVVARLLGLENKKKGKGESLDLSVRVGAVGLRFLNHLDVKPKEELKIVADQYDLRLAGITATGRIRKGPTTDIRDDIQLVHCTLQQADLRIVEKGPTAEDDYQTLQIAIVDLLFWGVMHDNNSIHTSIRDFQVAAASDKLHGLTTMINRSVELGMSFADKFTSINSQQSRRLKYLIYELTHNGGDVGDPPFLTRATYLSRASAHHLRTYDSWKIISRFRYIYQSLGQQAISKLAERCASKDILLPVNSDSIVMNSWETWRAWDIKEARTSYAFQHLYEPDRRDSVVEDIAPAKPLNFTFRGARFGATMDPGHQQSELQVTFPSVDLDIQPSDGLDGLLIRNDSEDVDERIVLHVGMQAVKLGVDWHITRLVESLLRTFLVETETPSPSKQKDLDLKSRQSASTFSPMIKPKGREIHVVGAIGEAAIALKSINLEGLLASKELRLSVLVVDRPAQPAGLVASALLHADSSYSRFTSHSKVLLRARADRPNIYLASKDVLEDGQTRMDLSITGSSKKISVHVKEDLLEIVEIADAVIRDEVTYMREHFMELPKAKKPSPESDTSSSKIVQLRLALLMDSYHIDVALLQSLVYTMNGKVGRLSLNPVFRDHALDLNFDLDEHHHNLVSKAHQGLQVISALRLPPVNGQIKVRQTEDKIILAVTAIIERIVVEGAAVHGMLNTLRKPEVADMFKAVQADIETMKRRVQRIYPPARPETPQEETNQRVIAFDVAATLAGLQIKADAPGQGEKAQGASLRLGLGAVQVKAFNTEDQGATIMPLPEIRGRLRKVYVELSLKDGKRERPCGNLSLMAAVDCTLRKSRGGAKRMYKAQVDGVEVNVFAETASAMVDVLNHLQDRLKELDLSRERKYLQRLRAPTQRKSSMYMDESQITEASMTASGLFTSAVQVSLNDIQVSWIVGNSVQPFKGHEVHDLVLSIKLIDLRSRSESSSRLTIEDVLLQLVPTSQNKRMRYPNSALLPYTEFNVKYVASDVDRKVALQAVGESLDLQLEPKFIIPTNTLQRSISLAVDKFREASASWDLVPTSTGDQRRNPFGDKRLSSMLVDVEFQGAVVQLRGHKNEDGTAQASQAGRYGQFIDDSSSGATFKSPGLAVKVEYKDEEGDSTFNAEVMVHASSNSFTPTVVPLILEVSNSIKVVVGDSDKKPAPQPTKAPQPLITDESLLTTDPSELLGGTSLNVGLRIRSQELSLSCHPIARVAASARFEEIYVTANNIKSADHDHGQFFAISAAFEKLQASVQHVYSRQSTFSFEAEQIVLSLMNSKHLNGTAGISAILKIYPTRTQINAKQLHDFLLFREIWIPPEIRSTVPQPTPSETPATDDYLMQRYQQITAGAAFPWNATIALEKMTIDLDLGQSIGKSSLVIADLWASSRKATTWEQNLCIGIGQVAMESTGRMSGFVNLSEVNIRMMIAWPNRDDGHRQVPRIQASAGFDRLRAKAAFDYQAFAIADISDFTFLMYNVREQTAVGKDRLVAILNGHSVEVFCTATSAAQGYALYQAFERLIQENQTAYAYSLKETEKYLRRQSANVSALQPQTPTAPQPKAAVRTDADHDNSISLYTHVVVTLGSINLGAFPGSFFDSQVLLLEASDIQARFAVTPDDNRVHSGLGMTLGQLRVALGSPSTPVAPKPLGEISVDDVVHAVEGARGGIILRVPKVLASMHTWQSPGVYDIDYIFKSSFEGKVDVGWNISRIAFIRTMWNTHSKSLATRLGKPLPEPALRITTSSPEPRPHDSPEKRKPSDALEKEKITAVVNVPQSKYRYHPREPPVIDTPQLRDMGEATPPLEWVGLQRDRLPNVVHQVVIVGLLSIAGEVGVAYRQVLGSA